MCVIFACSNIKHFLGQLVAVAQAATAEYWYFPKFSVSYPVFILNPGEEQLTFQNVRQFNVKTFASLLVFKFTVKSNFFFCKYEVPDLRLLQLLLT